MSPKSLDIAAGALVGYAANRAMDQATTWFYERQSDASKLREQEIAPGGTLVQVGKQLGRAVGRDLTDDDAGRVGLTAHRILGVGYGIAATALTRRGLRPLRAGALIAAGAFVIIDEGTSISAFRAYPVESHMRGVVGHAAYGLASGVLLSAVLKPG